MDVFPGGKASNGDYVHPDHFAEAISQLPSPPLPRQESLDWFQAIDNDPGILSLFDDLDNNLSTLLFAPDTAGGQNEVRLPDTLADDLLASGMVDSASVGSGSNQGGSGSIPPHLSASLDKSELLKEKNRRAQEKSRAKKKAQEREAQIKMESLQQQIQAKKLESVKLRQQAQELKARAALASTELAQVRAELARVPMHPAPGSAQLFPGAGTLALTNPYFGGSMPTHPGAGLPSTSSLPHPARASFTDLPRATAIFNRATSQARSSRSFKHHARISVGVVSGGKRCTLAQLVTFRNETARRLGCRVEDICWLLDATCHPDLSGSNAMTSHLGTPDCAGKLALCWLCTQIEITALLSILKLLEQARDALTTDVNCIDTASTGPNTNWPGPRHQPYDLTPNTSHSDSRFALNGNMLQQPHWQQSSHAHMHGSFGQPSKSPLPSNPFQVNGSTGFGANGANPHMPTSAAPSAMPNMHCAPGNSWNSGMPRLTNGVHGPGGQDHMEALAHRLFMQVLRAYVRKMHFQDALHLCKRLRTMSEVFEPPDNDGAAADTAGVVKQFSFTLGISKALKTAAQDVMTELRNNPAAPTMPATREAADNDIAAVQQKLDAVNAEWCLTFYLTTMDAPQVVRAMSLKMSPAAIGYVKFEEYNVRAYSLLSMTLEQKQELAEIWNMYTKQAQQLTNQRNELASQLEALPSSSDLDADDLFSIFFPTSAKMQSPLSLWTRQPSPGGWGNQFFLGGSGMDGAGPSARSSWTQKLLGVSIDATESASSILSALHDIQSRDVELYLSYLELEANVLTSKQFATLTASMMPFVADTFRIAGMAATDVTQQRLFGRMTSCALIHPSGSYGSRSLAPFAPMKTITPY